MEATRTEKLMTQRIFLLQIISVYPIAFICPAAYLRSPVTRVMPVTVRFSVGVSLLLLLQFW